MVVYLEVGRSIQQASTSSNLQSLWDILYVVPWIFASSHKCENFNNLNLRHIKVLMGTSHFLSLGIIPGLFVSVRLYDTCTSQGSKKDTRKVACKMLLKSRS